MLFTRDFSHFQIDNARFEIVIIYIKVTFSVIKNVVRFLLQRRSENAEARRVDFDPFDVRLRQDLVRFHNGENVFDFRQTLTECVELSENVHFAENERLLVGLLGNFVLHTLNAFLVFLIQMHARIKARNDDVHFLFPHGMKTVICDVVLAGGNHLISDLQKNRKKSYVTEQKNRPFVCLP